MPDYPLVYRCAVVVKPLQPFLDWLIKIESDNDQPLAELQEDSNIYLVPGFEEAEDIEKSIAEYVKKIHADIFRHELEDWYTDPGLFPKINYESFLDWFEVNTHTMVFDTLSNPIKKE